MSTLDNYEDDISTGIEIDVENGKSILYFGAKWCGPCKKFKPFFNEIKVQFIHHLKFYTLDIDNNASIADMLNIKSVPTTIFIKDGLIIDKMSGTNQQKFIDLTNNLLYL